MDFTIRPVLPRDTAALAAALRNVLNEHDVPRVGTAYSDPHLDDLYTHHQAPRSAYFVIEMDGEVVGGSGVGPLENQSANIAELQKMYFLPQARGIGAGAAMMKLCLDTAAGFKYAKIYLETMHNMKSAQRLYQRSGFEYIPEALGNTGHYSCPVHMIRDL